MSEPRPRRCAQCGQELVWLPTRHGARPFAAKTVTRADDPERLGFVPVLNRPPGAPPHPLVVPVADVAEHRLAGVHRVWVRDLCQEVLAMRPPQVVEHLALLDDEPDLSALDAHQPPEPR